MSALSLPLFLSDSLSPLSFLLSLSFFLSLSFILLSHTIKTRHSLLPTLKLKFEQMYFVTFSGNNWLGIPLLTLLALVVLAHVAGLVEGSRDVVELDSFVDEPIGVIEAT